MQATEEIAPHYQELTRALGDKLNQLDEQELKEEFEKYLEYGVPPKQAIQTILRHHGVQQAQAPRTEERVPLGEVPPNVPFVNLLVRVVTRNTKTVNARGEEKEIVWGLVGDETGTLPYTSWRPIDDIQQGDVIQVKGAYTKEFNNEVQIQFGDRCQIDKTDPSALPEVPTEFKETPIGEIKEGLRNLRVTGRILDVEERQVTARGEQKTLWSGTLADATGKVEFTSWHDHNLLKDQVVTIEGGYVRGFRGVPQFNFDEQAKVELSKEELPGAETLAVTKPMPIGELVSRGGGSDVRVVATLLEVRPGSGLVTRCGEDDCNRVLAGGQCRLHGKQEGKPDLRVKGVLDDGTGAVNVIVGRELTESLLGKSLDDTLAEAKEAMRFDVIQEQLEEKLTGRDFDVTGNALSDEFGTMLIARKFDPREEDVQAGAIELAKELEVL